MLKSEIVVGGVYIAKVSDKLTRVRVDAIRTSTNHGGFAVRAVKSTTLYDVTNLNTSRKTTFRSAAKFRKVAVIQDYVQPKIPVEAAANATPNVARYM